MKTFLFKLTLFSLLITLGVVDAFATNYTVVSTTTSCSGYPACWTLRHNDCGGTTFVGCIEPNDPVPPVGHGYTWNGNNFIPNDSRYQTGAGSPVSGCDPLTNPGTISGGGVFCNSADDEFINGSSISTSGCGGNVIYRWERQLRDACSDDAYGAWGDVNGNGDGEDFTIGVSSQYDRRFRRCVKRQDCGSWICSDPVTFDLVKPLTDAGAIRHAGNPDGFCDSVSNWMSNDGSPSGGCGSDIEYRWEYRSRDICGSTWGTWQEYIDASINGPGAGYSGSEDREFRRGARRPGCGDYLYTNVLTWDLSASPSDPGTISMDTADAAAGGDFCGSIDPGPITGTGASGGCGNSIVYQWQIKPAGGSWTDISGATGTSYNPGVISETTEYRRQALRTNCSEGVYSNIITYTVSTGFMIDCGGPSARCAEEQAQFQINTPVAGYTYQWTFEGNPTVDSGSLTSSSLVVTWPDVPGQYTWTGEATDPVTGCKATCTGEITITAAVNANAGPDAEVCQGGAAILDGSGSTQFGTFNWAVVSGDFSSIDVGATSSQPLVSPLVDTEYQLLVEDPVNGCSKTDRVVVRVNVNLNPIAIAVANPECADLPFDLDGTGSMPPPDMPGATLSYAWYEGTNLPSGLLGNTATLSTTASVNTTYSLVVFADSGCSDTTTVEVVLESCLNLGGVLWSDNNDNGAQDANEDSFGADKGKFLTIDLYSAGADGVKGTGDDTFVGDQQLASNGSYYFTNLAQGNYYVEFMPNSNYPVSSTTTATDPNNDVDGDDNGIQSDSNNDGLTDGLVSSNVVTLSAGDEPVGEPDKKGGQDDADGDANGNVTLDFGLVPLMSIGSTIFSDDNNNGMQDAGELSLGDKGKTVTLDLLDAATGAVVATTDTDQDGSYIFQNLLPGQYIVSFDPPMSLPVSSGPTSTADDQTDNDDNGIQGDANNDGITDGTITSPIITLVGGDEPVNEPAKNGDKDAADDANGDMTVDFGLVPLMSIGSTIFSDDNNNGMQDAGELTLGAKGKSVMVDLIDPLTGAVIKSVPTNADGSYIFTGLLPGDYIVSFTPPASLPLSSTPTDTTDNGEDGDDNGIQGDANNDGITDGVIMSPVITLAPGTEPTNEPGTHGNKDAGEDDNGDMTIDFGLVPCGEISGEVFVDENNNGCNDNEAPVAGVSAELYRCDANGNPITNGGSVGTTTTGTDGSYIFNEANAECLVPGTTYTVVFDIPNGYAATSQDVCGDPDDSDTDTTGTTNCVDPGDPTENDNVDMGIVGTMSIGSTIFSDDNNNGMQDAGEQTLGAKGKTIDVDLIDPMTGAVLATVTTDNDGSYIFQNLAPGQYIVSFDPPASLPLSSGPTDAADNGQDGDDNGIQGDANNDGVTDGTIMSPTITLTPGLEPTNESGTHGNKDAGDDDNGDMTIDFGLVPCGEISGEVFVDANANGCNDNEAPVAGVTADLYECDANGNPITSGGSVGTTTTGADGTYVFNASNSECLSPGATYAVVFDIPNGYAATDQDVCGDPDDSDTDATGTTNCVDPGDPSESDNVDLGVVGTMSIGSTIFSDDNDNGLQDSGEATLGAKGKTIDIDLLDAGTGVVVATTMTDNDGSYIFQNLVPGQYIVSFDPPSSLPVSSSVTDTGDNGQDGDDNGIQGDANNDGVTDGTITSPVITLTPGTEPTNESGTHGSKDAADDADGDMTIDFGLVPLMSIGSTVFSDDNNNGIQDQGEQTIGAKGKVVTLDLLDATTGALVATTMTDSDGSYIFTGLLPGQYVVSFDPPASLPLSSGPTALADDGQDGDDNGIQGDSNNDGITDGTIVSPTITLTPGMEPTNEPGTHGTKDGSDDANGDMTIDFGLVPCGEIGGEVFVDANLNGCNDAEAPVVGVMASLYQCDIFGNPLNFGSPIGTTMTGSDGSYVFNNTNVGCLVPGTDYLVVFDIPTGYAATSQDECGDPNDSDANPSGMTSCVDPGDPTESDNVDLGVVGTMSIGSTIFSDDNDNGIQDSGEQTLGAKGKLVNLDLLDATTGALISTTTTNSDGSYIFQNLVPGQYIVSFMPPASLPLSSSVTDMADNGQDGDDNGIQGDSNNDGVTDGLIVSPTITLSPGTEPTNESGTHGNKDAGDDANGDMTVDFGLVPCGVLSGEVFVDANNNGCNDNEAPVPGVTAELYRCDIFGNAITSGGSIGTTLTGSDGTYLFNAANAECLAPGEEYVVVFSVPAGYAVTSKDVCGDPNDSDTDATGTSNCTDPGDPTESTNVDMGLVGTMSIGSTVFSDDNDNGIQDADELTLGAKGKSVMIDLIDPTTGAVIATTSTNTDGSYIFQNLVPGQYIISFDPPASLPVSSSNTDIADNGQDGDDNGIQADNNGDGITDGTITSPIITLTSGAEPTNEPGTHGNKDAGDDANGDMTIDFGLTSCGGNSCEFDCVSMEQVSCYSEIEAYRPTLMGTCSGGNIEVVSITPSISNDPNCRDNRQNVFTVTYRYTDVCVGELTCITVFTYGSDDSACPCLASLGNFVWIDSNGDGIQDPGEPGVPNVTVNLLDGSGNPTGQSTTTDSNGNYTFNGLFPGNYQVQVLIPNGFSSTTQNNSNDDTEDSDIDPNGNTGVITLVSGQNDPTNDAGFIPLPSEIGNYVWNDLNANGIQDDGPVSIVGLSGFTVELFDAAGNPVNDINGNPVGPEITDPNGMYLFEDLLPGQYKVKFTPPAATGTISSYNWTSTNAGGNGGLDSDAMPMAGSTMAMTTIYTLAPGQSDLTVDGGVVITLPVELISFEGRYNSSREVVELNWESANEIGLDSYVVERSESTSSSFESIARVEAEGANVASYDALDADVTAGTTYFYRLRMMNEDGTEEYSEVISVKISDRTVTADVDVYPNPASSNLTVDVAGSYGENISINLYTLEGRLINQQVTVDRDGDSASAQLQVSSLPQGIYLLRVVVGTETFVERITVVD